MAHLPLLVVGALVYENENETRSELSSIDNRWGVFPPRGEMIGGGARLTI